MRYFLTCKILLKYLPIIRSSVIRKSMFCSRMDVISHARKLVSLHSLFRWVFFRRASSFYCLFLLVVPATVGDVVRSTVQRRP